MGRGGRSSGRGESAEGEADLGFDFEAAFFRVARGFFSGFGSGSGSDQKAAAVRDRILEMKKHMN